MKDSTVRLTGFKLVIVFFVYALSAGALANERQVRDEQEFLLNLLETRRLSELDARANGFQKAYEQGKLSDEGLRNRFQAFYNTDPALQSAHDEWVDKYPRSYAARIGRASYFRTIGWERRGGKWIRETPEQNIREMLTYFGKATEDLQVALGLTDKPILAYFHLLNMSKARGSGAYDASLIAAANKIDPGNYVARRAYLKNLVPRWGGSHEAMDKFLEQSRPSVSADTYRKLASVKNHDIAMTLREAGRLNEALAILSDPVFAGDPYALYDRYYLLRGVGKGKEAFATAEQLLSVGQKELDQQKLSNVLNFRGYYLVDVLKRPDLAFKDYLRAAEYGNPWAQGRVGLAYWHGEGVPANRPKAIEWFRLGAKNGDPDAIRNLKGLMDSSQAH